MTKILKTVAVIVVLLVGWKLTHKVASGQLDSSADAQVKEAIAAVNAQLPKDLGAGVTFTKAEVIGKTIRNTYSIAPGGPFDPNNRAALEATAVAQVCGAMAPMAKQGYTVEYHYEYSVSGSAKTLDVSVPPSKCT